MSYQTDQRAVGARAPHATLAWIVTIFTLGYMLPWAVACSRGARNSAQVAIVAFFLGWTGIGWVWALVMALQPHQTAPVPVLVSAVYYPPAMPVEQTPRHTTS